MFRLLIIDLLKKTVPHGGVVLAAAFVGSICGAAAFGQVANPQVPMPSEGDRRDPEARSIREMVAKQQINRRKKEHDEMLKQGDDALRLSQELEESFEQNETLTPADMQKLQELESIVSKIRKELGGNDDADKEDKSASSSENSARSSFGAAFKFLRSSTIRLVDELKKSTRFSISVAAIQASNSVIKFARFLRLKK